jgi:hypothetical protein
MCHGHQLFQGLQRCLAHKKTMGHLNSVGEGAVEDAAVEHDQ